MCVRAVTERGDVRQTAGREEGDVYRKNERARKSERPDVREETLSVGRARARV